MAPPPKPSALNQLFASSCPGAPHAEISEMPALNDSSGNQDIELIPIGNHDKSSSPLLETEKDLEDGSDLKALQVRPDDKRRKWIHRNTSDARGRHFEGWKFTAFWAFMASLVVLFFNVGFLLYCLKNPKNDSIDLYYVEDQEAYRNQLKHQLSTTLYKGDCDKVRHLNTGFHFLINVLSTALLGASNFGMQCLVAPTRQNIDRQHVKGRWLDIGVSSFHNLSKISAKRLALWLCLAISSVPLHLMYNSAIYSTTSATTYDVIAGPASLAQKNYSDLNITYPNYSTHYLPWVPAAFPDLYYAARNGTLHRLENDECVNAFAVAFQTTYRKLWLITDDIKENDTYIYVDYNEVFEAHDANSDSSPYEWLCDGWGLDISSHCASSQRPKLSLHPSTGDWIFFVPHTDESTDYHVQYCMAMAADQDCKLRFSFPLTMTVIVFNIIKACVLAYVWLGIWKPPILIIGDAITSFLRRPDPFTQNDCLLTRRQVKLKNQSLSIQSMRGSSNRSIPVFKGKRRRWATAVPGRQWALTIMLLAISIMLCIGFLVYGIVKQNQSGHGSETTIWHQSFGSVNARSLVYNPNWPSSLVPNVIIANSPQLIFSAIYFSFSGMLTKMCLAAEWSGYAKQRKGLRVSHSQKGNQRTNYFLSIPYRYSIPLLVFSTLLHWLISQSLFVVAVEEFRSDGKRAPTLDFITCSWSPVGIVSVVSFGTCMLLCTLGLSLQKFESAMPVASSCSLAIAAACHPKFDPNEGPNQGSGDGGKVEEINSEEEEEDMSLLPVQWGAIPLHAPIGHCSFTSGEVEMPQEGERYQ